MPVFIYHSPAQTSNWALLLLAISLFSTFVAGRVIYCKCLGWIYIWSSF